MPDFDVLLLDEIYRANPATEKIRLKTMQLRPVTSTSSKRPFDTDNPHWSKTYNNDFRVTIDGWVVITYTVKVAGDLAQISSYL